MKIKISELIKDENIRIKGVLKKRKESLEEFLETFLVKWNREKDTIFVENKKVQTPAGKRRSIGDIYNICKYYYPQYSKEELLDIITNHLYSTFQSKIKGYRSSYCNMIKKRVFYVDEQKGNNIYNTDMIDEYGYKWENYSKKNN